MNLDVYTAQVAAYSMFIGALVSAVLLITVFLLYQGFRSAEKEEQAQLSFRQKAQLQIVGAKGRSSLDEGDKSKQKAA